LKTALEMFMKPWATQAGATGGWIHTHWNTTRGLWRHANWPSVHLLAKLPQYQ